MDNFDLNYMKENGIYAGRCPGSNSRSVAETAVTFMLAASRGLGSSDLAVSFPGIDKPCPLSADRPRTGRAAETV